MQLQKFLVLALGAGAYVNTVAAGVSCWKSGPEVSVSNISPSIATICNYLQGNAYVKQETRSQCVQDLAGVMWDFSLTYIGSGDTRPITSAECQNGMNKQIQCQYGGETSYGNWKYRADPNFGSCTG
ncbi:hypothetical protein JMJ35_007696 [Cladonia borealis]|uniref:Glycan binding protein Y3-like domain-containing protein n=1 Tax=Cladonia borealis TaxID=184061 RepID=A0AA39QW23_9LECA|nr:hypothetical protein JMJ35_007696 [Cladonia borealis]